MMGEYLHLCRNYASMYYSATNSLLSYLIGHKKLKSLVIGISGGIDSAITAAIARAAVNRIPSVKLIGRSLPMKPSKKDEIQRSIKIGSIFCDDFKVIDLENAYTSFIKNIEIKRFSQKLSFEEKIRMGNIRARIRMIQLYHLAHEFEGMVLSTDNLTEYYLGFWTLHGDVGDFGMMQNLWKTEVYGLAKYISDKYELIDRSDTSEAIKSCIKAEPTDGLGITESDLIQIEADSYFEVDRILIDYIVNKSLKYQDHPVIKRYENTHIKRNNPLNISRSILID